MATRKCPFCAEKIKTEAKICRYCTREVPPVPSNPMKTLFGILALFIVLYSCGVMMRKGDSPPRATATKSTKKDTVKLDTSKETQQKRKALIQKLIAQGVFSKIEQPAQLPHAWTGPAWSSLPFDDKQSFCGVVLAYYMAQNRNTDLLVLKDGRTGKRIGSFDSTLGLRLD